MRLETPLVGGSRMVLAAWGLPSPPRLSPGGTGKGAFSFRAVQQVLRESGQTAFVQTDLNVTVPDTLQVDHGRGDMRVAPTIVVACGCRCRPAIAGTWLSSLQMKL